MARYAFLSMTKRETTKLDRLLEPLTEEARAELFDIIEDWHVRVKERAVERERRDLKCQIISDIASNF